MAVRVTFDTPTPRWLPPAAASRLLAMADGLCIVIEHEKSSPTHIDDDVHSAGCYSYLEEGERQVYT